MKNQTKLMAVLSAAALISTGAPILGTGFTTPVYANTAGTSAAGWVEENGNWRFIDSHGDPVTDAWKKSGEDWYYLNEEGDRTKDALVDEYYVNEEGKMVKNQWISVANEDYWDSPDAPEFHWYYFGKDGKSIVSKWAALDNKHYYFNENGHMMTGKIEVDGNTYYLGDKTDGIMKTGWVQLVDDSDEPDSEYAWSYFDNKGRMIKDDIDKKIDNAYYTFIDGKMQTGWVKLPESEKTNTETATTSDAAANNANTTSTVAGYQYYLSDGKRADGWYQIEGAKEVSEEGEIYSFCFKNGKPYYAETGIATFQINSKRYAFNTSGEMQTGLEVVTLADGGISNHYFGTDGVMKTGKQTIYDEDLGENQTWFFYTDGMRKGQGFHGIRENNVYEYGLRKDADADLRYAPVSFEGTQYLVNTSGAIQKASSSSKSSEKPELGNGFKDIKDDNGKNWVVDTNGVIQ